MMTIPIQNKKTTSQICQELHEPILEFTDAYFLVGVTASGQPIAISACNTLANQEKMNNMVKALIQAGGIPLSKPDAPRSIPGMPAWSQN